MEREDIDISIEKIDRMIKDMKKKKKNRSEDNILQRINWLNILFLIVFY